MSGFFSIVFMHSMLKGVINQVVQVLEHSKCTYISYWMNILEDSRYELNRAFLTVC